MRKSSALCVSAIALSLAMVPLKASAQGVGVYIGPGYAGNPAGYYGGYPAYGYTYPTYVYPSYAYPSYAYPSYAYPSYGYGYGRPYVGTPYWGQGRRVARRVNRRWDRWE